MPTLTLLLPPRARFRGLRLSKEVGRILGRADDQAAGDAGTKAQLQRHFDVIPRHCPEAAITRELDARDAITHGWLRADPAYVQADINGGRMLACGNLGLSPGDCDELLVPLRPLFGDEGFVISAPVPDRWYLMLPRESRLPAFAPPDEVLGDDLEPHLPTGDAGRRWRRLLNESQILLHNHPLNEERVRQGLPPVNSLWFWGTGVLPDFVRFEGQAFGEEALFRGLAGLAKTPPRPVPESWSPALRESDALIDLRSQRDLERLARDWILPVCSALRGKDQLRLDFADGSGFSITRGQRWRFWRRTLVELSGSASQAA